jgi:hypothetical protein
MDSWIATYADGEIKNAANKCGTTACALGHAGFIPSFRKAGLKSVVNERGWGGRVKFTNKQGVTYTDYDAGLAFFDLSNNEADWLFYPESYGTKKGPKTVAKRIRSLVKNGMPSKFLL